MEELLCVFPAFLFLQFKEFQAQGQLQDGAGQDQQLLCQAGQIDHGNLQELDKQDDDNDLGQGLFQATGNVRFGSLAALFGNDRRMSASEGKAVVSRTIFDSKILDVCFSQ